jgi:Xaa-Pro aminopeptidase
MANMKPPAASAKAFLQARQTSVRRALGDLKLDGLLLTHPPDLAYLSEFTGDDSIGLVTADDFFLVTDFRYQEQVRIEAPWLKVNIREGKMSEALAKTVKDSGVDRLGFEANFTPFGTVGALDKQLKENKTPVELVPVEDVMVNIRKVKDDVEIDIIRQAVEVAEEAYLAVREQIKPGLTENYIAGLMGFEMRCRGASDSSFPVIVAAGAGSSLPHYRPGEIVVKKDQPLLIDWGARFKGYCSDLTRTLMLGQVSPKLKKAYNITLEAQMAAIEFLRPGVTTRQADQVARDVIIKAGHGDHFGHGLGHGIGRDIHELPTMRKTGGEEELKPGMVVTVEPGIYLPGEGGIRIEDDVLITHGGHEVLSSLDKSFEGCHIE